MRDAAEAAISRLDLRAVAHGNQQRFLQGTDTMCVRSDIIWLACCQRFEKARMRCGGPAQPHTVQCTPRALPQHHRLCARCARCTQAASALSQAHAPQSRLAAYQDDQGDTYTRTCASLMAPLARVDRSWNALSRSTRPSSSLSTPTNSASMTRLRGPPPPMC